MMKTRIEGKMAPKRGCLRAMQVLTLLAAVSGAGFAQSDAASKPAEGAPAAGAAADKQAGQKQEHQPIHSDSSYVIGTDDLLAINVWKEQEISRTVPVRSDGKISLPLVGELTAGGQTPLQLEQEITKRLQSYISEPEVTVIVQETLSKRFSVVGQVAKPGSYALNQRLMTLDAIALAGGFREFAKVGKMYVLRVNADGSSRRLPFNYKRALKGEVSENFPLEPGDTIVVP